MSLTPRPEYTGTGVTRTARLLETGDHHCQRGVSCVGLSPLQAELALHRPDGVLGRLSQVPSFPGTLHNFESGGDNDLQAFCVLGDAYVSLEDPPHQRCHLDSWI